LLQNLEINEIVPVTKGGTLAKELMKREEEINKNSEDLAKLDDGLAESPTVMVVETKNNNKTG
jgi:hypothetical protein